MVLAMRGRATQVERGASDVAQCGRRDAKLACECWRKRAECGHVGRDVPGHGRMERDRTDTRRAWHGRMGARPYGRANA